MSRISHTFEKLSARGEKALVAFLSAGDPDRERSMAAIRALVEGGADVLELGVPFSDPTADGPVIQRASQRALSAGMTLPGVLSMAGEIRAEFPDLPVVIFSYYNPILSMDGRFHAEAVAAGADGLLVVDLPVEESDELTGSWDEGLDFIRLVAPTTPKERMKAICEKASGFVYLVSMTGVTGSEGLKQEVAATCARAVKSVTGLPLCVGFGVSTPEQAGLLSRAADGVVVGSAFCKMLEQGAAPDELRDFAASLKQGMKESGK
ncbi:MAG: tryptophan synthase subunit alpha [Deltaproteobacteria bacterium]|nr:tryptophan synthase subunit alpha [Deltaproteobacteria bacterium]